METSSIPEHAWHTIRRKKYICLPWVPLEHAWSWKQAGCRVVLLPEFFAGFGTTCEDFCALHYHPFPPFEALPSLPCLSQHPRPTWGVMEFAYFFFLSFYFYFLPCWPSPPIFLSPLESSYNRDDQATLLRADCRKVFSPTLLLRWWECAYCSHKGYRPAMSCSWLHSSEIKSRYL